MREVWKDVVGYEGLYQVSNKGRLNRPARLCRARDGTKYIQKKHTWFGCKDTNGYMVVDLYREGKFKRELVHRVVAQAFIPNPENKRTVNHKNGKHDDNRLSNLERATMSEQLIHKYRVLGYSSHFKGKTGCLSSTSKKVCQLDMKGNIIKIWDSITEAANYFGTATTNISGVCKGNYGRNTCRGYKRKHFK